MAAVNMLGSDIEVFGYKTGQRADVVTPAFDILEGDVDIELPYGKVYPDGAANEFTVEPSSDPTVMADRIFANYSAISELMAKRGYSPSLCSYAYVGKNNIDRFPESFGKRASLQILGCNADFRIYPGVEETKRPDPKVFEYRTLGGHIHLSLPDLAEDKDKLVKLQCYGLALDATVGLFTTINTPGDDERQRRRMYGLSGTYRTPVYGFEYRVPSAKALLLNKDRCRKIFAMAKIAVDMIAERIERVGIMDAIQPMVVNSSSIRTAIDGVDRENAAYIFKYLDFARKVEAKC